MSLPVALVHGITDQGDSFTPHLHHLGDGRSVHAPDLAHADGSLGLAGLAADLALQLEHFRQRHQSPRIDLVAHSLGGMVARYYLQRLGGMQHVRRLVTIATPHRGTYTAYGLRGPLGRELRPGSAMLRDLDSDWGMAAAVLEPTCLWSPFDVIISPGWYAIAPYSRAVRVNAPRHHLMLGHPATWQAVRAALEARSGT